MELHVIRGLLMVQHRAINPILGETLIVRKVVTHLGKYVG